ncbi:hypothetical protein GP2_078_00030 [Gordonia paraffinivorans NBRC 108238]|uniref:Uncharacterized protein n=1 Tax=Gordonia paraffinivorans NBRC 108238 TaxID=1223543 RepID=A0ABQ0IRY0_9ACTN|nr:hypothetical protein [Gordonia paraffinivorans]GAC86309.1 hypothetical protein GP2_078_00030 [Gordonia paraffinivorans NBRC 108238]
MIAGVEYAVSRSGHPALLRQVTEQLAFAAPRPWIEADNATAISLMASRILIRPHNNPTFPPNVAIQYFDLGRTPPLHLGEVGTARDIATLDTPTILSHSITLAGALSRDEGTYLHHGQQLHIRRSQLSYTTDTGNTYLSILTSTSRAADWQNLNTEFTTIEQLWFDSTITTPLGTTP